MVSRIALVAMGRTMPFHTRKHKSHLPLGMKSVGSRVSTFMADDSRHDQLDAIFGLPPAALYDKVKFATPAQLDKAGAVVAADWGPKVLGS